MRLKTTSKDASHTSHNFQTILMQYRLLILLTTFISLNAIGQQNIPFSNFAQSNILWNPAETGMGEGTNAFFQYRHQWAGFEGAPKNMAIGVDHYLGKRVGLGTSLFSEQVGPLSNFFWNSSYAYHLPFEEGTLSFGMNFSVISYNGNFTQLQTIEDGDLVFSEDIHLLLPNFGTGLVYYTDQFKIGLSIPRLLENKIINKDDVSLSKAEVLDRDYYVFANYEFTFGESFDIQPSMMLLYDALNGSALGFNTQVLYNKKLGLNMGYNSQGWLNGGINFAFNETLSVFYSYSWSNNVNSAYFGGSHEFTLAFRKSNKL